MYYEDKIDERFALSSLDLGRMERRRGTAAPQPDAGDGVLLKLT